MEYQIEIRSASKVAPCRGNRTTPTIQRLEGLFLLVIQLRDAGFPGGGTFRSTKSISDIINPEPHKVTEKTTP